MKRICVVVASRANYGRCKSILRAIRAHSDLDLQLIVSASALLYRFGQVVDLIEQDGFKIAAKVYAVVEGENLTTMAKSTGLAIIELSTLFENLKPDMVLTVGDRYETMATAIAASYMNIPLAHTMGGEITGSIDESVRHAVTKLSHLHFTATELARERVIRMGEDPDYVYNTGCPSIDLVAELDLTLPRAFFEGHGGAGDVLDSNRPYLVVLQHPVTTEYGEGFAQIEETIRAVETVGIQTVWLWPNADAGSDDVSKGLRHWRERRPGCPVHFYRNLPVESYARLIKHCACLVGNSSSAIREGAFLGVPAVNIGSRQSNRERASNVLDVGYEESAIGWAIRRQVDHGPYAASRLYGDGSSGESIAARLAATDPPVQKMLRV